MIDGALVAEIRARRATSKTRGCRDGRHAPAAVLSPRIRAPCAPLQCHWTPRRYAVGVRPVCLRNEVVNELVSLKPRLNPICVTDIAGFAKRDLACWMRRLLK